MTIQTTDTLSTNGLSDAAEKTATGTPRTMSGDQALSENGTLLEGVRARVFQDRYALKDREGVAIEQYPEQMWQRVARGIAAVETTPELQALWEARFYEALEGFRFVPGGRVLSSAGTGFETTYYNCFVIESPQDSRGGILDNLKILTEIMARGGGVGVNLSTLRPRGSYIKTVNGTASGPVSWAELYSVITGDVIQQGGTRRGALMIMLDDDHPDIEEFITAKRIDPITNRPVAIEHANISVAVSDAFMDAVKTDSEWPTQFPTKAMVTAEPALAAKVVPGKTFKARDLWRLICRSAWASAEPGVVFVDRYNDWNNTWYYQTIRCTNPCVTGDTLIATAQGLRRAGEMAAAGTPVETVIDGRFGQTATTVPASPVFCTGIKPVYRLQTREGYFLRATGDHRVMTARGWVEVLQLEPGDQVHILNRKGGFGQSGSLELGRLLGWLATSHGDRVAGSRLPTEIGRSDELGDRQSGPFKSTNRSELPLHPAAATPPGQPLSTVLAAVLERDESPAISQRLQTVSAVQASLAAIERVPEEVFQGSEAMQRGFLQALFSGDGRVTGSPRRGCAIMLATPHGSLIEGVQQLLLNFGIASHLYHKRRTAFLPAPMNLIDGAEHAAAIHHELMITKRNVALFADEIGFLLDEKQIELNDAIVLDHQGAYGETFTAMVESVIADGFEPVYDLTEPLTHSFIGNGIVVHNCGEQGLAPWNVCNLAALNLASFVDGPTGAGRFDFEALERYARIGLRFSDNVIDANLYFFQENADEQLGTRRTGLGTMGLADALIKMGIRYGSAEAEQVIEQIYRTIRDAAYDESTALAAEKGPFPRFDRDKYLQGKFIQTLPGEVKTRIAQHGIRNAVILTQAPTGTTSLVAGVSSGIEPVFDFAFKRIDRTGESIIYHPLLKSWMDEHPGSERPAYFVGANDLTPEDHIRVQAMVQKYTDSSISKTCNAPNDHTVEEVDRLYLLAYESGCKGVTYYRDGSRDAVLHHIDSKEKTNGSVEATPGTAGAAADPLVDRSLRPRPAVVHGYTRNLRAPEGTVNITLNSDDQGLLEVFVNVGRAGSDIAALAEALGRLVGVALRLPSPMSPEERTREIATQLRGIGGSRTVGFGLEQLRSLPDAIGLALQKHLEGQTTADTFTRGPLGHQPALPGLSGNARLTGNLCPECGSTAFVFEEGCKKCHACGFSEC